MAINGISEYRMYNMECIYSKYAYMRLVQHKIKIGNTLAQVNLSNLEKRFF